MAEEANVFWLESKQALLKRQWETGISEVSKHTKNSEKFHRPHDAVFFRGTNITDILQAYIEHNGILISPHAFPPGSAKQGTIITTDIEEATFWANRASQDEQTKKELLKRIQVIIERPLTKEEEQALIEPIILAFTSKVPKPVFEIESGTDGFLITESPIGLKSSSITDATASELIAVFGKLFPIDDVAEVSELDQKVLEDILEADRRIRKFQIGESKDYNLSDLQVEIID